MSLVETEGTYWFVALDGSGKRVRLPTNAPLLVGRGEHNHVVLDDYRISRQHSRVAPERDGYVVYDLNSVNGTHVNGTAVRRQQLRLGDEVRFGPFSFRFELQQSDTQTETGTSTTGRRKAGEIWRPVESITRMWRDEIESVANVKAQTMRAPPSQGEFRAPSPSVDLNRLEDAYENLNVLYRFVQTISTTLQRRELLDLMSAQLLEIFPVAVSVSIYLRENAQAQFELALSSGVDWARIPFSPAVARAGRAIFAAGSDQPTGHTMYAPMMASGVALGVICVAADPRGEPFNKANLELLNGMAAPSTIMLQNARMYEESLARERLRRDLELAAQIQQSFLPVEVLSVEGVEFLAAYRAAYAVGGDFYDIFWVSRDKLAVFVGDIAGKGIAAALLMARISGELRVASLAHVDPVEVLSIMNKAILGRNQPELFFTGVYLTLDVKTGEVVLVNAGHPTPYICHPNGDLEPITAGASTAVGMFEDTVFQSVRMWLDDGDSLVLYTDGVVEAADQDGALFGQDRLEQSLNGVGSSPDDISSAILRGVEAFAGQTAPSDDVTIFVCHRDVNRRASLQPRRIHSSGDTTPPKEDDAIAPVTARLPS